LLNGGVPVFSLDSDDIRSGLCSDPRFTTEARHGFLGCEQELAVPGLETSRAWLAPAPGLANLFRLLEPEATM